MGHFTKSKRLGKHYLRYLLSYMAVLMIPLVILTFFYSSRFLKKFYEEIYETVDLELVQISTQMESELDAMQNIINQLTLTNTIHLAAQASSPLELTPTMTSLAGFTSCSAFIEDIILVLDHNDYLVTSTTTSKKDYFFSQIFHASALNGYDFLQMLENSTTPRCIPPQELQGLTTKSMTDDAVLFSYPLYTDYQKREGTALFYVNTDSIRTLLSQKLQTYQSQLYIIDPTGTIVTTSGSHDVMRPFLQETSDLTFPTGTARIEREDYVIRTYQSTSDQWSYVAFIPDKQTTFSQVSDIMKEFLMAIVIILLLASFTIFFLQKVNYAPVRLLRDKAKQISPAGTSSNELATISNALDYLSEQNTTLSTQLQNSLTAVKNERLYRLLGGDYSTKGDFNLDCSELDLYLGHSYFHVAILMLHSSIQNLDTLAQEIKHQLKVPYIYYYLNYLHPNQIVLLLNLPEASFRVIRLYEEVQCCLAKKHSLSATIGIGSIVSSTDRIAQSYMEAASALDYRFVKGNGTLIEFREALGPEQASTVYPHQEFEILRNALFSQNEQNIRTAIQNIIQFMEQHQLPLYLARSICFDLIHLVNEHCQNKKHAAYNSPLELSGMETAREIIQILRTWSENLIELTHAPVKNIALEDVLLFLDDNCLQCDFSVYEAALHFNMTLPAFSKFFKDRYGQNVMDYTILKRIQKAKELLERTNLPLKDISEQVGYYNISSFTRRFKLNQGITPGDYRKMAKEGR